MIAGKKKNIKLWLKKHYKNKIQDLLLETFNSFSEVTREVIYLRYCQRKNEQQIMKLHSDCNVRQAIEKAKQQLQATLLRWSADTLNVSLDDEKQQVEEMIEEWLSRYLIYIEL